MEQLWIEGIRTNLPKVKMLTWTSRLYKETRQNVWSAIQNNYRDFVYKAPKQNVKKCCYHACEKGNKPKGKS